MVAASKTIHTLIAENRRNSLGLVALFCAFTGIVAAVLGVAVIGILEPQLLSHLDWTEGLVINSSFLFKGKAIGLSKPGAYALVCDRFAMSR